MAAVGDEFHTTGRSVSAANSHKTI